MQKRCCSCFKLYEEGDGKCPHCGYVEGNPGKEPYHLSPGTVLTNISGEKYVIGEAVGTGGFGITYLAWDENLERIVAIKEYYPNKMVTRAIGETEVAVFSGRQEEDYKRGLYNFLQEAKIMSLFAGCENVCNSYDQFEANGTAYMVMEFLSGQTLKQYIKARNGEPLEEEEVLSIITQILQGLDAIHKRGALHLDIAPDNVFVMKDGKIKISDFGAARTKKVKKDEEEMVLKPGFAPPEQYVKNGKMGPWTDIYAVGATLYWLLTLEVPLESTDREKGVEMAEPAMLNLVSPLLNNITMRAMALRPELRYKSSEEVLEEFQKEKVRSLEAELKRRKRNRRSFLVAVMVVVLASVASITYYGMFKNKIFEDSITVWVSADETKLQAEEERYAEILTHFKEIYSQIEVEIRVKDAASIEKEFSETPDELKPDLIETGEFSEESLAKFETVSSVAERMSGGLLSEIFEVRDGMTQIPTAFYVSVLYTELDKELSELQKQPELEEFLQKKEGYCLSDSTVYFDVQEEMAGRYRIEEPEERLRYLAEEFSVYRRNGNKKKAATAFLEYLLTDAAQDLLHVQSQSGFMPVAENAMDTYLDVYNEFDYLKDSLKEYSTEK